MESERTPDVQAVQDHSVEKLHLQEAAACATALAVAGAFLLTRGRLPALVKTVASIKPVIEAAPWKIREAIIGRRNIFDLANPAEENLHHSFQARAQILSGKSDTHYYWWTIGQPGHALETIVSAQPEERSLKRGAVATFGFDNGGHHISFPSGEALLNGKPVTPNKKIYLRKTDEIVCPHFFDDGGKLRLQLMPGWLSETPALTQRSSLAREQTDKFSHTFRLKEPVADGFEMGIFFDAHTSFLRKNPARRGGIVVDRQADPILRATVEEAKDLLAAKPRNPAEAATLLTKFTRETLRDASATTDGQRAWSHNLYDIYNLYDKRILLGDHIAARNGICGPKAALLKVLADEVGLNCTLVGGGSVNGGVSLHAFNYFKFAGIKGAKIFDAEVNVFGLTYNRQLIESGKYVPGNDAMRKLIWKKLSTRDRAYLALDVHLRTKALPVYSKSTDL